MKKALRWLLIVIPLVLCRAFIRDSETLHDLGVMGLATIPIALIIVGVIVFSTRAIMPADNTTKPIAQNDSITAQIEGLTRLKEKGLITENEMEQKRRSILGL